MEEHLINEIRYSVSPIIASDLYHYFSKLMSIDTPVTTYRNVEIYFGHPYDRRHEDNGLLGIPYKRLFIHQDHLNHCTLNLKITHGEDHTNSYYYLPLTNKAVERLLEGEYATLLASNNELAKECYRLLALQGQRPIVQIGYTQKRLSAQMNGIAIRFDTAMRANYYGKDKSDETISSVPILDKGQVMITLTYKDILPFYIKQRMDQYDLSPMTEDKFDSAYKKLFY